MTTAHDLAILITQLHDDRAPLATIVAVAQRALEAERERCARLLETKQAVGTSSPPHHRLIDDDEPDVARRLYAAAIRALT